MYHNKAIMARDKTKVQEAMLGVAGMNRNGGSPDMTAFFQKNNSDDRGFTFNFDGSIIEYKKPAQNVFQGKTEYNGVSLGVTTNLKGKKQPVRYGKDTKGGNSMRNSNTELQGGDI